MPLASSLAAESHLVAALALAAAFLSVGHYLKLISRHNTTSTKCLFLTSYTAHQSVIIWQTICRKQCEGCILSMQTLSASIWKVGNEVPLEILPRPAATARGGASAAKYCVRND